MMNMGVVEASGATTENSDIEVPDGTEDNEDFGLFEALIY